jgi:hypothetical protein
MAYSSVATIGQIHRAPGWMWLCCANAMFCSHQVPMGIAAFAIRWGSQASTDVIRQRCRCTKCGHLGATLQHPSWVGRSTGGDEPFPARR